MFCHLFGGEGAKSNTRMANAFLDRLSQISQILLAKLIEVYTG